MTLISDRPWQNIVGMAANLGFQSILVSLLFACVSLLHAERLSLDGEWEFQVDPYAVGEEEGWEKGKDFKDSLEVPGNWDLRNEFSEYAGTAWYKKIFGVPAHWSGRRIQLHFEAVYNDCQVWVNGEKVGQNNLGFLPFHFEVAGKLRYGSENSIVLRVDNTFKRGAIWNWGGIRRSVWLDVGDACKIDRQWITAEPDLVSGTAQVTVEVDLSSTSLSAENLEVSVNLSGHGASRKSLQLVSIGPKKESKASFSFKLPDEEVNLWHFNSPSLYESTVELVRNGQTVQTLTDRFGIRSIEVDGTDLKLNGEAIRLVGFNIVPEDRTTGSTLPLWRIQEDVDMLKTLGANMMRLSHLPLPKAYLDYLDEKGILVFEEVPLWGRDLMVDPENPIPKEWLNRIIREKFNHPCVIGWSVGNEIGRVTDNPKVFQYVKGAVEQAKAVDPSRLAVYVSHSARSSETDAVIYSDMLLINSYGDLGKAGDNAFQFHGPKPVFMSEYGNHLNHEDPNLGVLDAGKMMDSMRGRNYLMGASLWTFNDYRSFWQSTNPTWSTGPSQNRSWGVVNVFRQPKRAFYSIRREYAPLKELKVQLTKGDTLICSLRPRLALDLPAYPIERYRIVWEVFGSNEQVLEGDWRLLPRIQPGSEIYGFETEKIESLSKAVRIEISLLDPQGYVAMDKTVYLERPGPPKILKAHSSKTEVRLILQKDNNTQECWVEYETESKTVRTEPTINRFVTVSGLQQGKEYRLRLVASNEKGETRSSDVVRVTTDFSELPPVIWETEAGHGCAFVGFSVGPTDYLYEVRYGKEPGRYDKTISFKTRGVARIPNLENGATYYLQMRRLMQWGFASGWSHEVSVTTMKVGRPDEVAPIKATLERNGDVLLRIDPLKFAVAYTVEWTGTDGKSRNKSISGSKLNYLLLEDVGEIRRAKVRASF